MFKEWAEQNDIGKFHFDSPLFPKANDREFWGEKYDPVSVEMAEQYLDFNWPVMKATDYMAFVKTGNRVIQEKPFFERRRALMALFLGEIVEYKGRFLGDIVNGIFSVCEETFWGFSAHHPPERENDNIPSASLQYIDLFASDTAELLAVIYYTLYDELDSFCPEILVRIEYELDRRIIVPYLEHTDYWWMGYTKKVNNWNPWILSNILTTFLIMEKRRSVFNVGLKKMLKEIDNYYSVMPDDGGCDEGCGYWMLAGAKLFEFCDQLFTATDGKINFFGDEKLCNIARYVYRAYIGDGRFVNFADCPSRITENNICYVSYMCGLRTGDEHLLGFAKSLSKVYRRSADQPLYRVKRELGMIIHADDIAAQKDFVPLKECVLPDLQCSFMRSGKWFYAAKGGHNDESHNHNDIGSFTVYFDDAPVLADTGCGVYTKKTFSPQRYEIWTMQSAWHNLPVINGYQQKDGADFRADSFSVDGKVTGIGFAGAYPKECGLESAARVVHLDNGVIIKDKYGFTGDGNEICEHFITPLDTVKDGDAVIIGGKYRLEADKGCEISLDFAGFEGDERLTGNWNTDRMNRIGFTFSADKQSEITFTLRRI